jgi:hypothetical protein
MPRYNDATYSFEDRITTNKKNVVIIVITQYHHNLIYIKVSRGNWSRRLGYEANIALTLSQIITEAAWKSSC